MIVPKRLRHGNSHAIPRSGPLAAAVLLAVVLPALSGCNGLVIGGEEKEITVTASLYEVGADDCDSFLSGMGEFSITLRIARLPSDISELDISTQQDLGSPVIGEFINTYNFGDVPNTTTFMIAAGESLEISGTISETDAFPEIDVPPTPWSFSRVVSYEDLGTGDTIIFDDGPGCFSDERIQLIIVVSP